MAKQKSLEQLRAEKEQVEKRLAQEQHKLERLENRKKYLEKGERQKRTHRLCNLGGTIESLAPEVKNLTRTEMTELMEHIFGLPEVQRAVRHMEITHINQANRGKELKANGRADNTTLSGVVAVFAVILAVQLFAGTIGGRSNRRKGR